MRPRRCESRSGAYLRGLGVDFGELAGSFDLDHAIDGPALPCRRLHLRADCLRALRLQELAERGDYVRVLLLEVPQLLRGILEHAINAADGCEVLRPGGGIPHGALQEEPQPDAVILGVTASVDNMLVSALFARWPQAQVMTVMQAGHEAAVYELRPERRLLGELSPTDIVETLRSAVLRRREFSLE